MAADDEATDLPAYTAGDGLRHDLKSPLTTIHGRAELLSRAIRRSPSLAEPERAALLAHLLALSTAVQAQLAIIETIRDPAHRHDGD
jgi:signal transduction histidine kinase